MPDMLVKLYELPPLEPLIEQQADIGITIRRTIAPESHLVVSWVRQHFSEYWASECTAAYAQQPPSCFVAVKEGELIGFACYDTTVKNFFGPTGVSEAARGHGTGRALFMVTLHAMRWAGYAYAIIGSAGPTEFYEKAVGATIIPDSSPGIYRGMLRRSDST